MGRIKSTMIKRSARKIMESKESELFVTDFEKNKTLLSDTMPSKPIRNKVAGYISRLVKEKKEKQVI